MTNDKSQEPTKKAIQNLEQAKQAMQNYLQFWERSLTMTPWGNTELVKRLSEYAHRNIDNSFEYVQRLAQAKGPEDILRIQAEFFQSQMQSLNEQAKDIGTTVIQATKKSG